MFFSGAMFPDWEPFTPPEGWWGRGPKEPEGDTSIREFKVSIPDSDLEDLDRRLSNARYGEDLVDTEFQYGFPTREIKKIVEYWRNSFDWRKQEAILNQFQQYKTTIEGIDVHFMRVKPKFGRTGKPLLLVHGWPGSVWEFYKIIPMLTDPAAYGGKAEDAFEVIAPSIPGYGFSEAPHRTGFSTVACAGVFVKLMARLGHDKFLAQGGDWGAAITTTIAQLYPDSLFGYHTNMLVMPMGDPRLHVHQMLAMFAPSLILGEENSKHFKPLISEFGFLMQETGYFHIQSTKPDTVGMGLNDSPIGLAGYILEKFPTWTNRLWRDLPDGGLTKKYTLDELLTNVMIYWLNGNIASSQRFYKENMSGKVSSQLDRVPVKVPSGHAIFPEEVGTVPKPLAEYKYKDIIQFTYMPRGGHFAALEEPQLLAEDFFSFVKKLEKRDKIVYKKSPKERVKIIGLKEELPTEKIKIKGTPKVKKEETVKVNEKLKELKSKKEAVKKEKTDETKEKTEKDTTKTKTTKKPSKESKPAETKTKQDSGKEKESKP